MPEDSPPYVTGARPLSRQEAAFRRWVESSGAQLAARLADEDAFQAALTAAAVAFAAGWEARRSKPAAHLTADSQPE
jgi:hypothetical protein